MNWLFSITRIVGASFPVASSLVQLQAERDSNEIQRRLRRLEDPLSALHPQIRDVSGVLYQSVARLDSARVELSADQQVRFSRALAILETEGMIKGCHAFGHAPFIHGLWIENHVYLLYMAALFEKPALMDKLVALMEATSAGEQLDGTAIATDLGLPSRVVKAVFQAFAAKGFGYSSQEVGAVRYVARV